MTSQAVTAPRRSALRAWLALARPHFVPMSLSAGLVGVATGYEEATAIGIVLGLAMCIVGYPFGVMANDLADREADAINAPDRPLVTGEISPAAVVRLLVAVGVGFVATAAIFAPAVAIWSAIAIAGHGLYQATKGIPMVGNVVNGLDMALFCVIGAAGAAADRSWLDVPSEVWIQWGLIAVVFNGFCLVGYFKDVPGDRAAGYRTLPVVLGPRRARWLTIPSPVIAVAAICAIVAGDPGAIGADDSTALFWVLIAAAAAAFALSLRNILTAPETRFYEALLWFTRGTVAFMLALGAAVDPTMFLIAAAPMLLFLEATLRQTQGTGQA